MSASLLPITTTEIELQTYYYMFQLRFVASWRSNNIRRHTEGRLSMVRYKEY